MELTGPQRDVIAEQLRRRIHVLKNLIRENVALSQPCPDGYWRWADVNTTGYGRKTSEELNYDREQARARADAACAELETARSALAALRGGDNVGNTGFDGITDQQLLDELKQRDAARREAERRQAVLAVEMRRAEQAARDGYFAEGFGLTAAQLEEIGEYLADDERFFNLNGYHR